MPGNDETLALAQRPPAMLPAAQIDTELAATSKLQYEFQRTTIPSNSDVRLNLFRDFHANQTTTHQPE
jgi:hypothetical protein